MDDGALPFVEDQVLEANQFDPSEKVKRTRGPRRSRTTVDPSQVIRVSVTWNPKRTGTKAYDEFALYRDGMTVGEFWAANGKFNSLLNDEKKGYIRLEQAGT